MALGSVNQLGREAYHARGEIPKPPEAVAKIHEMAGQYNYDDIADRLNEAGYRTAFGRPFTHLHVGYICRCDGVAPNRGRRQNPEPGIQKKCRLIC